MDNATDERLIIKLKRGKVTAFDSLFRKYSRKLYSFVFSYTGSHEDAEDITQEVFFRVWQNRHNINPELSFNAYIIVIARNLIFNLFRKRLQNNKYATYKRSAANTLNHTEDYIIFSELQQHSNMSVEKLPARCKQIFMLSRENGLSIKEIATQLNISPSTVENQINKALKLIRKDLGAKKMLAVMMIIASL
ncbi:RNA polymerase sigma-70 factor [Fulvivirgaceae bacterium BMA12]|uniref:RNA polymerase sigma-70 factor n=1 Tax=Agaribacillus aureus TaxID=3051825 RepID=A0ABT8L6U1_9BACT|nr:RNA polymerase sigma-70 factor [Fulvivirgaceae bacterium BMA12]